MKPLRLLGVVLSAVLSARAAAEENPINLLRDLLSQNRVLADEEACGRRGCPPARSDLGQRFGRFVMQPGSDGMYFLDAAVLRDRALRESAEAVAVRWAEGRLAAGGEEAVASLYYVLGFDGQTQAGVEGLLRGSRYDALKEALERPEQRARALELLLFERMPRQPIDQRRLPDDVADFLNRSADLAVELIASWRPPRETELSINANELVGDLPPTVGSADGPAFDPRGGPSRLGANNRVAYYDHYSQFDQMYREGAAVGRLGAPAPIDDGYREISIKLCTRRTDGAEGAPPVLVDMICVTDITGNAPGHVMYIPIERYGRRGFNLRTGEYCNPEDETRQARSLSRPGTLFGGPRRFHRDGNGRCYAFNADNDCYTLSRAGAPAGAPGAGMSVCLDELVRLRAQQVRDAGLVSIPAGGRGRCPTFRQPGENGVMDLLVYCDGDRRPSAVAHIGQTADGVTRPVEGNPDLGLINGRPYHLRLVNGAWEVHEGAGTPPPSEAAATPDGTGRASAGLQEVIRLAQEGAQLEEVDNSGFSDGAARMVHIMRQARAADAPADEPTQYVLLFDGSMGVRDNQFLPASDGGSGVGALLNIRGYRDYLVMEFELTKRYIHYQRLAAYLGGRPGASDHVQSISLEAGDDEGSAPAPTARYRQWRMSQVADAEVAADMLTRYVEPAFSSGNASTLRSRITGIGQSSYIVEGGHPADEEISLVVMWGGRERRQHCRVVWPELGEADQDCSAEGGPSRGEGGQPSYQFALGPAPEGEFFPTEGASPAEQEGNYVLMDVGGVAHRWTRQQLTSDGAIALYFTVEDQPEDADNPKRSVQLGVKVTRRGETDSAPSTTERLFYPLQVFDDVDVPARTTRASNRLYFALQSVAVTVDNGQDVPPLTPFGRQGLGRPATEYRSYGAYGLYRVAPDTGGNAVGDWAANCLGVPVAWGEGSRVDAANERGALLRAAGHSCRYSPTDERVPLLDDLPWSDDRGQQRRGHTLP